MDRHSDIDNFEKLLKERSEEFKMYPTKRVWHSIYNNIHPGKKWPSIATCIVLISILLLIGFLNTNDAINPALISNNKQNISLNPLSAKNQNITNNTTGYFLNNQDNVNYILASTPAFNTNFLNLNYLNISVARLNYINNFKLADNKNILTNNLGNQLALQNNLLSNDKFIHSPKLIFINKKTNSLSKNNAHINSGINTSGTDDNVVVKNEQAGNLNEPTLATPFYLNNAGFNELPGNQVTDEFQNMAIVFADKKVEIINNNLINSGETTNTQTKVITKKDIERATNLQNKLSIKEEAFKPLVLSDADKAWVENYALYNRPVPKKWAGKLGWQLYITPSIVYRTLKNIMPDEQDVNKEIVQHPSIGLEIGSGIIYPIFKGLKVKTGLQVNYTRYNTEAYENSHPVSTSIMLSEAPGQFYQSTSTTPFSNYGGITPTKLHNETYQISIPIGLEFKIAGNDDIQWNIASTLQPSYIFGGQSYLISADKRNFIKENTYLNHWNLNAGFETFISYKTGGYTLQFGPQFRKQIFTTNSKVYTIQEKLTNYGIRFGITKLIK